MDEAKVLIGASGMKILPVSDLEEAARLAVKLSKIVEIAKEVEINVQFKSDLPAFDHWNFVGAFLSSINQSLSCSDAPQLTAQPQAHI